MDNLKEQIYYAAPVWLQHVLVSAYGISLRRRRYGKGAVEYLQYLINNEEMDVEEIRSVQDSLFVTLAQDAISHVPFYRDWATKHKFSAGDIKSLEELHLFPVLDKETVRRNPHRFFNERILAQKKTFTLSTSGTTGSPLLVLSDPDSRTRHYAFWSRIRAWFGLLPLARRATFFGRIIMLPAKKRTPFWRHDWAQNNLLFSSYHLSEENLQAYVDKLERYRPDELIGYPSSLYQLAHYIVLHGLVGQVVPKVVFTTAENLLEYQRHIIANAFQCPVINQYGCTEMAMFASECEHGTLHLHPEHGFVEVLPQRGAGESNTSEGEAVCTGLVNMAMPLIRYRLGDQIRLKHDASCICGRALPVIDSVEGRSDDIIRTPDGRLVGRLDPVFKGFAGIKECQIVQENLKEITINIVCDPVYNSQTEKALLYEFRKRLGDKIELSLVKMPQIPRNSGGKFRPVISKLNQQVEIDQ